MEAQAFPVAPGQPVDPHLLRAYAEVQRRHTRQRAELEKAIRQALGLDPSDGIDWSGIPSAAAIRRQLSAAVPEDDRLSDLIVAMREE